MTRLSCIGIALIGCLAVTGCGPDPQLGSGKNDGGNNNGDGGGNNGDGGNNNGDGGGNNGDGGSNGCFGLECLVDRNCPGGAKTTLNGTVYAPNGTLPLYNATVFVPNGALDEFTEGVTCDRCDGTVSGNRS